MTTKTQNERAVTVDLDLDALRAGNADGRRTKTFRFGGEVYEVPGKLPLYVVFLMGQDRMLDAMQLWLGDEQNEKLMRSGMDETDFEALMQGIYRESEGKSEASAA